MKREKETEKEKERERERKRQRKRQEEREREKKSSSSQSRVATMNLDQHSRSCLIYLFHSLDKHQAGTKRYLSELTNRSNICD